MAAHVDFRQLDVKLRKSRITKVLIKRLESIKVKNINLFKLNENIWFEIGSHNFLSYLASGKHLQNAGYETV